MEWYDWAIQPGSSLDSMPKTALPEHTCIVHAPTPPKTPIYKSSILSDNYLVFN